MVGEPLSLYVVGRLRGVTRKRLVGALATAGGRLVRRPGARITLVALAHSSAPACLVGPSGLELPKALPGSVELVSEVEVKRRLGLAPPPPEAERQLSAADLSRAAGLTQETIRCFDLYDVLDGAGGRFGFRDLLTAREAKRLLKRGFALVDIVEAALALRRQGRGLFDTSLSDAPWGEILQHATGRLARLDGQYLLPLDDAFQSADELFELAEECETVGDLDGAERFYRRAAAADPFDPVIPFNLGNVLDGLGQPREAAIAYRLALGRDASFAEAWVNLAGLRERGGRIGEAEEYLGRAVQARPDYGDALFSLASLLTRQERYREALLLWDRFLALEPQGTAAEQARRQGWLCSLATAAPQQAGCRDAPLPSERRQGR
jgi:tetratricopeptide (TPR) repeat protein